MAAPTPRPAAGVMVFTRDGRVLIGRRREDLSFLGGFAVFPGGRVEADDTATASKLFGESASPDSIGRAAALRELYEEAGLVLDGTSLRSVPEAPEAQRFDQVMSALDAHPVAASLEPAGRWITPEYAAVRYDTRFYVVQVEGAVEPGRRDHEMDWIRFERPEVLLASWHRHEIQLAPPTRWALECLALGWDGASRRLSALPEAKGEPVDIIEGVSGVRQMPLRTPTLPPATHTNAYLVGGERFLIVDPATYEDDEREKLLDAVVELERRTGGRAEAIFLTHHHGDHMGAATWLAKAHRNLPVLAHEKTAKLLEGEVLVDRFVSEGEVFDLGRDAAGVPFELLALHTPGHASGHLVLEDRRPGSGGMICGDMVAAVGTIIIDPPDGHMGTYLAQLERLKAREPRVLFPAHGPPIVGGVRKLDEYVTHRLAREAKVLAALVELGRAASPEDLLPSAYADTPPVAWPLAARSALAHLEHLSEIGKARRSGDRFEAA